VGHDNRGGENSGLDRVEVEIRVHQGPYHLAPVAPVAITVGVYSVNATTSP
jgi:hypothetical protein